MRNTLYLTKVQLLSFFNINRARYSKERKEQVKIISLLLLSLLGMALLSFFLYLQAEMAGEMMSSMGMSLGVPTLFYTAMFALTFISISMRGSGLFISKDLEQTLSLPVTRQQFLLSKILVLYLWEIASALMFFVPAAISYTHFQTTPPLYWLWVVLGVLVAPILPLALGALVSLAVNFIFLKLPFRNILSSVVGIAFSGGIIYLSLQTSGNMDVVMTEAGVSLAQSANKFFPLANWFSLAFFARDFGAILLFISLSLLVLWLFVFLLRKAHPTIVEHLQKTQTKKKYQVEHKSASPMVALLQNEFRKFFANSAYVINTISGSILMLVVVVFMFLRRDVLSSIIPVISHPIAPYLLAIITGFSVSLTSITAVSISLDGKFFGITKSFPVAPKTVFLSKILHQVIVYGVLGLVILLAFSYLFHLKLWTFLLAFLLMMGLIIATACVGTVINLHFYQFDWKNEVEVIKQGAGVILSMITNVLLSLAFFLCLFFIPLPSILLRVLATLLFELLVIFTLWSYLTRRGQTLYEKIEI